jgi:hypothetical protein
VYLKLSNVPLSNAGTSEKTASKQAAPVKFIALIIGPVSALLKTNMAISRKKDTAAEITRQIVFIKTVVYFPLLNFYPSVNIRSVDFLGA